VTILLLDDEPLLRRATALLLAHHGGCVTPAATPDEAVALAAGTPFDVAILDLSREGASAADVLRRMRASGSAPQRVIAVSDAGVEAPADLATASILRKPYPFDRLLDAVFDAPRKPPSRRRGLTVRLMPRRPRPSRRGARDPG
jgi:DNA-binding response OmpR family regulator